MDRFSTQQHIQALSMRNREDFLERITAATPIIEELVKVEPSTWRQMGGLFMAMQAVGMMNMLGNFTGKMQQAAMFPMNVLTSRVGFMLEGLMMPMLPIINKVTMAYEAFVMQNQTGALIGGGIGIILGSLVGHPMLGMFIGSTVGGGVQAALPLYEQFTEQGGQVFPYKSPSGATPADPLGGASGTTTATDPIVMDQPVTALPGVSRERIDDGRIVRYI